MSGLVVQLYVCEYPEDVYALLLLDPIPDESLARFVQLPPPMLTGEPELIVGTIRSILPRAAGPKY